VGFSQNGEKSGACEMSAVIPNPQSRERNFALEMKDFEDSYPSLGAGMAG
jgi:hypothetical protein